MESLLQLAASRIQLCMSSQGQPHAVLPCGASTPIYSEDFYTFLTELADGSQTPMPGHVTALLRRLDAQSHSTGRWLPVSLRSAQLDSGRCVIDLQTNLFDAINVTREGWAITQHLEAHFLRPTLNIPLPVPETPKHNLKAYLKQLFQIEAEPAAQLNVWLTEALRPNGRPPILVISGEARDEAASKLRMLIDPVPQPLMPLPHNTNQLGQLALTNRVLAFPLYSKPSATRKAAFNALLKGMPVRLKETNKRRPAVWTKVARPIILTSEKQIDVNPYQITIEINHASVAPHAEVFAALLDALVQVLNEPASEIHEIQNNATLPALPGVNEHFDPPGP